MGWITSREYRDACRHIEAANANLKLASHYVRDDPQVVAMVDKHRDILYGLTREVIKVAEDAKEREEPPKNIPGTGYLPCS